MTATPKIDERTAMLTALSAHVRQRAGLEFGNYGDVSSYRAEQRRITRQRHDFDALMAQVAWRTSIDADALRKAFRSFSGRLEWHAEARSLSYCTGQYFPTEYRAAACSVLGTALFDYYRGIWDAAGEQPLDMKRNESAGSYIRLKCREAVGSRIGRQWCD